mmetsp:Transcript_27372/g.33852  ORF Transcript_27372/g.33852 Transcript_27372/m.33852 type:complete len:187 (-) Transcript_27372:383-943(-)
MHLLYRSCLMLIASFLLFVPSYMTNAFQSTPAQSAKVGSLYAIGCLISVSIGSKPFANLSQVKYKVFTIVLLLGLVSCISICQMLHVSGVLTLSTFGGSFSMFLWGVGFDIPFYIPPSLYALRQGGKESSATIADAFDFVGFLLLAWFNGFVSRRQKDILVYAIYYLNWMFIDIFSFFIRCSYAGR